MRQLKKLRFIIFSTVTSFVVAFVWSKINENPMSLLVWMGSMFILTMLKFQWDLENDLEIKNRILSLLSSVNFKDSFDELAFKYNLGSKAKYKNEHHFVVDFEEVKNFWIDSTFRASSSMDNFSYIRSDEAWDMGWNERALSIQKERIASGVAISRVFVLDANEKISNYKNILEQQKSIGIKVFCVYENDLKKNRDVRKYLSKIGSYDFSILDKSWLRIINLNAKRQIKNMEIKRDKELVQNALFVFNEAKKLAQNEVT